MSHTSPKKDRQPPSPRTLFLKANVQCESTLFSNRCGLCCLAILSFCFTGWILFFALIYSRYPDAIDDLLTNQELSSVEPKPINSLMNMVTGQAEMARTNVTILGVGKNIEKHLPSFLRQIESLGGLFKSSQAIFAVGSSDDSSLAHLHKWALGSQHNRTIISIRDDNLLDDIGNFRGFPMPREGRIAFARNAVLDHMQKHSAPTEYVINVDMDVIGWNVNGVQDSFGRSSQWEAVCANGVLLHGIYRDIYALRLPGVNTNHHLSGTDHPMYNISANQKADNRLFLRRAREKAHETMDNTVENMPPGADLQLLPVNSCFGGMTIYRRSVLGDCRYSYRYPDPPYMLDCEHVLFHQCLAEQNHARITSNPNMKLWYGHSDLSTVDVKKALFSLLPH